jgi:hypothetical protein
MKLIDKAFLRKVSESSGRNASEPIGGLVRKQLRRPSPLGPGEGSRRRGKLTEAATPSGGVGGTAR